jgi:glucuronate isomerase
MRRFRRAVTDTVGFHRTAGFVDDARALCSIPARHDVARRIDCGFLAELVCVHRIGLDEAAAIARDLAHDLPLRTFRFAPRGGGAQASRAH